MKTYTHNLLSAAVVAALTFSGAAIADEYQTLETTTVTAGRFEQDLMETPMSVSVVTREQIEQSNARNVGELLELLPGIQINNDGGQGMKRIKIRGENAFRTLVMIDGQKVSEQKSMSGAPMLIDPAMIERIEVIKGRGRHLCCMVLMPLVAQSTSSQRKGGRSLCREKCRAV